LVALKCALGVEEPAVATYITSMSEIVLN